MNNSLTIFILLAALTALWLSVASAKKRYRRKILRESAFPSTWHEVLQRRVPLFKNLPEAYQAELCKRIQVFVAEKNYVGCAGLKVTEEIKVTIAAYALILVLAKKEYYYPKLYSILVYPSAYRAPKRKLLEGTYQVIEGEDIRLGESWRDGKLVIAWSALENSNHHPKGIAHNVALHEFAHQLDQEDGASNGVPLLASQSEYAQWARVMSKEYKHLQKMVAHHASGPLRAYGATDPAEFFAVITEAFFETPERIKKKLPDIYEALSTFYELDPASWQKNKAHHL